MQKQIYDIQEKKDMIKAELDRVEAKYGYIPSTTKLHRNIFYHMNDVYRNDLKEGEKVFHKAIVDLKGIEALEKKLKIEKEKRLCIVNKERNRQVNHTEILDKWVEVFEKVGYLPSGTEMRSIPEMSYVYNYIIYVYRSMGAFIKAHYLNELYELSNESRLSDQREKKHLTAEGQHKYSLKRINKIRDMYSQYLKSIC